MADGATLYIDGAWVPADDGTTFESANPADPSVIGRVGDGSAIDAEPAITAASDAFESWKRTSAYVRAEALIGAHILMTERAGDLARLMSREQGKPVKAARNEVNYGADFLSWFAEEAKRIYGSTIPSPRANQRLMVLRQPLGVVAAITPWNYPCWPRPPSGSSRSPARPRLARYSRAGPPRP